MEPVLSSTTRRRGHQHHPRHATRRRLDQSLLTTSPPPPPLTASSISPSTLDGGPAQCGPVGVTNSPLVKDPAAESSENSSPSPRHLGSPRRVIGATRPSELKLGDEANNKLSCDSKASTNVIHDDRPAQCGQDGPAQKRRVKTDKSNTDLRRSSFSEDEDSSSKSPVLEHAVARARGDGNSDEEGPIIEEDPELAELAMLRCPSERTEVQAEREARRRKRCADYPGLAFGCSIFSSDTMMKFSLIRNELQNIMGNQLKRVSILV